MAKAGEIVGIRCTNVNCQRVFLLSETADGVVPEHRVVGEEDSGLDCRGSKKQGVEVLAAEPKARPRFPIFSQGVGH